MKSNPDDNILVYYRNSEFTKYNKLTQVIFNSIDNLLLIISGENQMTDDYEKMLISFMVNQVPDIWKKVSYISEKSLIKWI